VPVSFKTPGCVVVAAAAVIAEAEAEAPAVMPFDVAFGFLATAEAPPGNVRLGAVFPTREREDPYRFKVFMLGS